MVLETTGIDKYDKIPLLVNRRLTQIQVVAPGGLSKVAKARRDLEFAAKPLVYLVSLYVCKGNVKGNQANRRFWKERADLAAPWRL